MQQQDIFDTVAKFLFKQGRRSWDDTKGMCMYRGPDGLKCAVGALIPDDMYNPKMDCYLSDTSSMGVTALLQSGFPLPDYFFANEDLLADLQRVHDDGDNWWDTNKMRDALRSMISRHPGLSARVVDDLRFWDR